MTDYDAVKDSGQRTNFSTGSRRDVRTGKGRYDLIPPYFIKRLAQHLENGAVKYGDRNWELGQPLSVYLDSALRHLFNVADMQVDEDHPSAAVWNVMAFIHTVEAVRKGLLPEELDDIHYLDALWDVENGSSPEDARFFALYSRLEELRGEEGDDEVSTREQDAQEGGARFYIAGLDSNALEELEEFPRIDLQPFIDETNLFVEGLVRPTEPEPRAEVVELFGYQSGAPTINPVQESIDRDQRTVTISPGVVETPHYRIDEDGLHFRAPHALPQTVMCGIEPFEYATRIEARHLLSGERLLLRKAADGGWDRLLNGYTVEGSNFQRTHWTDEKVANLLVDSNPAFCDARRL